VQDIAEHALPSPPTLAALTLLPEPPHLMTPV
jgi:hypothetical protein